MSGDGFDFPAECVCVCVCVCTRLLASSGQRPGRSLNTLQGPRPPRDKELSGLKPVMEVPGTGTAQLTSANVTASELPGASLAVQWLGPHASTAVGTGSIPDWETKIQTSV